MSPKPGTALPAVTLVAAAFALAAVSAASSAAPRAERGSRLAPARASAPARLLVSASEYRLTLSRPRIARGGAIVQLLNRGQDDHDLRLRRISSRHGSIARWSVTRPGRLSQLTLRLSPGRYRLWCSLAGHRRLGMRALLRVGGGR